MSWFLFLACKSPIVEADYLAITSLSPSPEADGVAVDAQIFATFNEPLVADTVHDASVWLAAHDGTSVPLEVLYDEADNVVVATPLDPLSYDTAYALHISSDVEGADAGPLLAGVETRFRTGEPGPGPSNRVPVAHAGNDAFAIAAGDDYRLDGTASADPEGQTLDYHWRLVSRPLGSSAFVEVPDAADPVMRPDLSGAYLVGLVVGDGYNVTLSCVVPVSTPAEHQKGQIGGIYYRDDLLVAPFQLSDGAIEVPMAPGMGIDIDEAKIARYRVPH